MIPGSVEGELGFVLEGAKGVTMDDAFPVALEFGSKVVGGFGVFSAEALFAFRGVAIEKSGPLFSPSLHEYGSASLWNGRMREGVEGMAKIHPQGM